jgi:hypothetical protein
MKYFRCHIYKIIIGVSIIIFLFPILGVCIYERTGFTIGQLWYFGLETMKDFFTFWIAFFGIIGVAYNIWLNMQRNSNQEKLIRDNRFAESIKLLGNENESARIGGIYNLYFWAKEFEEYRESVFKIFCSHIRSITIYNEYQRQYSNKPSNEIQTLIDEVFRNKKDLNLFDGYKADFHQSWLKGANFKNANLRGAIFSEAHLEDARFISADLSNGAKFKDAYLKNTWFSFANWDGTDIESVDFRDAIVTDSIFKATNYCKALNLKIAERGEPVLPV